MKTYVHVATIFILVSFLTHPLKMSIAQTKPVIIAHRGASGYLPEHTLAAAVLAHAQGADFIEQDTVLTRDNIPIVLHDIHLDTVTDVAKNISESGSYGRSILRN